MNPVTLRAVPKVCRQPNLSYPWCGQYLPGSFIFSNWRQLSYIVMTAFQTHPHLDCVSSSENVQLCGLFYLMMVSQSVFFLQERIQYWFHGYEASLIHLSTHPLKKHRAFLAPPQPTGVCKSTSLVSHLGLSTAFVHGSPFLDKCSYQPLSTKLLLTAKRDCYRKAQLATMQRPVGHGEPSLNGYIYTIVPDFMSQGTPLQRDQNDRKIGRASIPRCAL